MEIRYLQKWVFGLVLPAALKAKHLSNLMTPALCMRKEDYRRPTDSILPSILRRYGFFGSVS